MKYFSELRKKVSDPCFSLHGDAESTTNIYASQPIAETYAYFERVLDDSRPNDWLTQRVYSHTMYLVPGRDMEC